MGAPLGHDMPCALVHTRYAGEDLRNHFIVDGTQAFGNRFRCEFGIPLATNQDYFVADTCLRYVGYVNHTLIHTDTSQDRCLLTVNEHTSPIFWCAAETICVPHWHDSDACGLFRYVGTTITDTFACRYYLYLSYLRFEG